MNILIFALIVVVVLLVGALAFQVFLNIGRKAELEKIREETYPKGDYHENSGTSGILVPKATYMFSNASDVYREANRIRYSSAVKTAHSTTPPLAAPVQTHVEYPKVEMSAEIYKDRTPGTIIGVATSRVTGKTLYKHRDENGQVRNRADPMTLVEYQELLEKIALDPFAGPDWKDSE